MRLGTIRDFLQLEVTGGVILLAAALFALVMCNGPWSLGYQNFFLAPIDLHWGVFQTHQPFLFWINEGMMTLFFLLVGLELKREWVIGELSSLSRVMLPAVAALGGMAMPMIIYITINYSHPVALTGFAVPVATDIAFSLGVLSLFGKRVPPALKIFLMTLAIFDDIGAIIIITFFYVRAFSLVFLMLAVITVLLLQALNLMKVYYLWPYLVLGLLLWLCMEQSGIHPTIAGVLLALTIPLKNKKSREKSLLQQLEEGLHYWIIYFVMPLFALANAGVDLRAMSNTILFDSVTIGIVFGLVLGKQAGIFGLGWFMIKLGWARLPKNTSWLALYGVALIGGIGFTMSLFLGTLAFEASSPELMIQVRLGVMVGSLLSGILGAVILSVALKR